MPGLEALEQRQSLLEYLKLCTQEYEILPRNLQLMVVVTPKGDPNRQWR
jgi:hypothetical protein